MSTRVRVRLHGPDPIEGPDDLSRIGVSFIPVQFPQMRVTWEYVLRGGEVAYPCGMHVGPAPGVPEAEWLHVSTSFLRDLPFARLERAARLAVEQRRGPVAQSGVWSPDDSAESVAETARAMVREHSPALDPDAGAGAARRWNRLVRLAEVVQEHQAARLRGEKAPVNAVAEARGVAPATVRVWLHHAKQEGIVPRAVSQGSFMAEVISSADPGPGD